MMDKVAFQFSGGKDSTAALYLLKEDWPEMTVYWLNSGDAFPELTAFVRDIGRQLPNFVEVPGRVHEVVDRFGFPSDLIPFDASDFATNAMLPQRVKLQNRGSCCFRSKMEPLMERMFRDGINVIIRGQKATDQYKSPLVSGDTVAGIRFLFPLQDWTDDQVYEYLESINKMPPMYESGVLRSGDCMACSAWLGDNRPNYLRTHHPETARILAARLDAVASELRVPLAHFITARKEAHGNDA